MVDIEDFYLNTLMERYEYMKLKLSDTPNEIRGEYKLQELASSEGYVYCEIQKGMYGLPQAGIIAQELLAKRLAWLPSKQNCPWAMEVQHQICMLHLVC
jgi:hypothetical protein